MSALRNVILALVAASAVTACQSTEIRRCEWKPKDPRYLQSSNCCDRHNPSSPCYQGSDKPNDQPDEPNRPDPIPQ